MDICGAHLTLILAGDHNPIVDETCTKPSGHDAMHAAAGHLWSAK